MGYFDTIKGVEEYIKMAEGYDGRALIKILQKHLRPDSSILELGMGPGTDLDLLQNYFDATGSDRSEIFVNRYQAANPLARVAVLNAVDIDTDSKFDAIYSNKVLQHLSKNDTALSLASQHRVLNTGGIAFHSLWYGDDLEEFSGMLFQQYSVNSFSDLLNDKFELIESMPYAELEDGDSIYVILKRLD